MDQAQKQMLYESKKKSTGVAYIFYLLFGLHYAYLGEWGMQLLYWFTAGGLGIWVLIDLFRIPSMVHNHNTRVMMECNLLYQNSTPNVVVQVNGDTVKAQPAAEKGASAPAPAASEKADPAAAPQAEATAQTPQPETPALSAPQPAAPAAATPAVPEAEGDIRPFHTRDGVMRGYMYDNIVYRTRELAEAVKRQKETPAEIVVPAAAVSQPASAVEESAPTAVDDETGMWDKP